LKIENGLHVIGPPLTRLADKLSDKNWITAWLLDPGRLRPNPHMPRLRVAANDAHVLASYLFGSPSKESPVQWQGGNSKTGAELFVRGGCRGCHTIGETQPPEWSTAPDLAGIGLKVRGDWLFRWLVAPRAYNPATPHPQMNLGEREIRDLVAFLMTHREGADAVAAASAATSDNEPSTPETLLRRFDCARCHRLDAFVLFERPTGWMAPPRGCAGCHTPDDTLEPAEAASIDPATALAEGRRLITYYNCRGCHQIEGQGGVIANFLERKSFAPPSLDGEGARVRTAWLIEYLQKPRILRPWLEIHMPNFDLTAAQARMLAAYFAAVSGVPAADASHDPVADDLIARGQRRLLHYKCLQCHPTADGKPERQDLDTEDLSIDLGLAATRLRPAWLREFLAHPKHIAGNTTRMPAVFYDSDSNPKVDDPQREIESITAYLENMSRMPLPAEGPPGAAAETPAIDWTTEKY